MEVTLKILRFNPESDAKPHWQEYPLELEPTDRLLDALNQVKWYHDGTLAYRRSCAHGICGSDAMTVNNVNRLACKLLMRDLGKKVTVEPLRGFTIIKDLVVDMEPFFFKYRSIKPYFINYDPAPPVERRQSPEERARYDDTTKCILCAACTSSCPSYWGNPDFVGPAAIVQAHRFIFDSRDQGANERLEVLNDRDGVWRCRTIFNCTGACPRDIKVTQAIGEVKKLLLFNRLV
ncbi:MAG: succinate dehydrogenase iron-sulfur subunit [Anaerolineae bacterium]|jgi:succinate dehydrogenase / fumarate reductase iron-sulfur subunit|nr:succinate dehydrogenase iron-sulfur subunit [Anaerolineae bacterium]MDX9831583.1 succinate dehydrogenase iron-sulfur subunit [Anaerolineae bacterium]